MEKARDLVKESHELVDTPLYKVFPMTKPIFKLMGKVRDESKQENEHLIGDNEGQHHSKKKKHHAPPPEDGQEPDPLNFLGFGMIAYKDLMFTMFWLFAVLSIIMIPAMSFYSSQGAIDESIKRGWAAPLSLGAFGYSSSVCSTAPMGLGAIPISCNYGVVGEVVSVGVLTHGEQTNICHTDLVLANTCYINPDIKAQIFNTMTNPNLTSTSFPFTS